MADLPPVVQGDPFIDRLNHRLWRMEVPKHSAEIQRLQAKVIEKERKAQNAISSRRTQR